MSSRIVEYHMGRLQDKSPAARMNAIQELVLLEAFEAMPSLEELFHTDPDEDVRKAAQRGGRELFLKQRAKGKDE